MPGEAGCNRNEAITWFQFVYPRTQSDTWPEQFRPVNWKNQWLFSIVNAEKDKAVECNMG